MVRKGFRHSEESKKKICLAGKSRISGMRGKYHSKETKQKMSIAHSGKNNAFYGQWHSEETRKKLSESHKGKHFSPKTEFKKGDIRLIGNKINVGRTPYNKGLTIKNGGLTITLEERKRRSEETKRRWDNPEYRRRRSEETKKLWENEQYKDKLVKIHKELNQKTTFKKGHKFSEDVINKIREFTLKQYESGQFPKQTNTKPERQIKEELLKRGFIEGEDFIHQYKFMNKFMCDFCFPQQKVIVEVYGDFWHANPQKYPDQAKLHPHQKKDVGRDKSKEAYITTVDNRAWTYLILWESDIKKDVVACVDKIEEVLKEKKI